MIFEGRSSLRPKTKGTPTSVSQPQARGADAGLMSGTSEDRREDFHNVYDLDEALVQNFRIQLDEAR